MRSTMAKKIRARREFADQIRFLKKDNQWSYDQAVKRASELRNLLYMHLIGGGMGTFTPTN